MTADQTNSGAVSLAKYIAIIVGVQFAAGMTLNLIEALGVTIPPAASNGASIGGMVAGIEWAMRTFVQEHQRSATAGERWRLAAWAAVAGLGLAALVFFGLFAYSVGIAGIGPELSAAVQQVGLPVVIGGLLAIIVFSVLITYWLSGISSRRYAKLLNKVAAV